MNTGKYLIALIRNEKVEGSIPFSGTNQINDLAGCGNTQRAQLRC